MLRRFYFSFLILTLFAIHNKVKAQQVAIGEWRIHAALQDAISVVDAGDRIYCATKLR